MSIEDIDVRIRLLLQDAGIDRSVKKIASLNERIRDISRSSRELMDAARFASKNDILGVGKEEASNLRDKAASLRSKAAELRLQRTEEMAFLGVQKKVINEQIAGIKKLGREAKAADDKMKGFRMEFLGIMFAGQALQRFFGGLFKDMLKFYKSIAGSTNPLNKSLTSLEANFSFLKYSIIEAMGGPIMAFTDLMMSFISFLTDQDPAVLEAIGLAIVGIAAAGALMFVGGQTALAANSIGMFLANMKDGTYGASLKKFLDKDLPGFKTGITNLLGAALTIYAGIELLDFLTDSSGKKITIFDAIKTSAMAGVGVGMLFGPQAGAAAFVLTFGLQLIKQPDLFGDMLLSASDAVYKLTMLFGAFFIWWNEKQTEMFTFGLAKTSGSSFSDILKGMLANSAEDKAAVDSWIGRTFIEPFNQVAVEPTTFDGFRRAYTGAIIEPMEKTPGVVTALNTSLMDFSNGTMSTTLTPAYGKFNVESSMMNNLMEIASKEVMPNLVMNSTFVVDTMLEQANATNKAAAAQERLNKAMANKPKGGNSTTPSSSNASFNNSSSVKG